MGPEQVPAPEVPNAEEKAAETPDAEAETPPADSEAGSDGGEAVVTDEDLAATVAAIRALDDEELAAEEHPSLAPEPALTLFGCNVPTSRDEAARGVSAGGDYLIAVAGLFGLIIARVRPGRNRKVRKEDQET